MRIALLIYFADDEKAELRWLNISIRQFFLRLLYVNDFLFERTLDSLI